MEFSHFSFSHFNFEINFFSSLTSEGKIIFNTILTAFSHLEKKGKYLTLSRYYDEHTQNSIVSGKLLFFVLKL